MRDDRPLRVLVIDDDDVILESCQRALGSDGFSVDIEREGLRGRDRAIQGDFQLVLVGLRLPDADCLDLVASGIAS